MRAVENRRRLAAGMCSARLVRAGLLHCAEERAGSNESVNVRGQEVRYFLVAAALFWLFGFGLMYGSGQGGLIGGSLFLFNTDSSFLTAFFLFQLGFIGTATTLMSTGRPSDTTE